MGVGVSVVVCDEHCKGVYQKTDFGRWGSA